MEYLCKTLMFMMMAMLPGGTLTFVTTNSASASAESKESAPEKSDLEILKNLEKVIYSFSKSGEKPNEKQLRQVENKAETLLITAGGDDKIKSLRQSYPQEIRALAENYLAAAKAAQFQSKSTLFRFQIMCKDYANAYKALAKGDITTARLSMKGAKDKRNELHDLILK